MNEPTQRDAFISYSSVDHAAVKRIVDGLRQRGLSLFLDYQDLIPGRPWPDALERHLARCRAMAVVLGPSGMGPCRGVLSKPRAEE